MQRAGHEECTRLARPQLARSIRSSRPYDLVTADHDFRVWEGPPLRTLLICTHPRSGSTMLGEALYFAGGLGCALEYFHGDFQDELARRWRAESLRDYVLALWRYRTDPSGTLAIKLFWADVQALARQIDPVALAEIEAGVPSAIVPSTYRLVATVIESLCPSPVWIHLERRDTLRQAVSAMLAMDSGVWRDLGNSTESGAPRPEIDFNRIDWLRSYSAFCHGHWRNLFATVGADPLAVSYEELAGDYSGIVGGLLAALGRDLPAPPQRMRRQADAISEALLLRYLRERAAAAPPRRAEKDVARACPNGVAM